MRDTERDAQMINAPGEWPAWPFLPLVKRDDSHDVGVLHDDGSLCARRGHYQLTVLLTNIWAFDPGAETITYDSVEDLLADGWEVD